MSLTVTSIVQLSVKETSSSEFVSADDPSQTWNGMSTNAELTASTTPPVTKHTVFTKAMSGGAGTIDLTSLPDTEGNAGAVTFSGLKIQRAKFTAPTTNANDITITLGASNGHPFFTADGVVLSPGQSWTFENLAVDTGTDVAAGDATWDLTGTGSQELDVHLVAG